MTFKDIIDNLNSYLEDDAKEIIKLLKDYQTNPINAKSKISLNAYDFVVPFDCDPIRGTQANKDLTSSKGNYIFVMTKDYERAKDFNNVYSGAQLKDHSIKTFKKNDVLYLGTAQSILSRMHQHFKKDDKYDHTGSLKLGSDERNTIKPCIIIYAFCLKKEFKDYYSIICPKVEKYLHENLNVLVGND